MQVIINSVHQLESLLNKNKRVDFSFEFVEINDSENKRWLKKVKQNYFACGCHMGKIFFMYALVIILLAVLFTNSIVLHTFIIIDYVSAILFIFLMMGIGKAVGKFNAYKNLKKDIAELKFILK